MIDVNYDEERKKYIAALDAQKDAALDAIKKALNSIGVTCTLTLEDSLWDALDDMERR